jgi:spore maturation protein CgeB
MRVFFLKDIGGLVEPDIIETIYHLGIELKVKTVYPRTEEGHQGQAIDLNGFARELKEFKPHFIFFVNAAGCDGRGILSELYAGLQIPVVCWFVDQPAYYETWIPRFDPENTLTFMIDREHMKHAVDGGLKHIYHLPLGTNCRRFTPKTNGFYLPENGHDISFVGRLMAHRLKMLLQDIFRKMPDFPRNLIQVMDRAAALYADDFRTSLEQIMARAMALTNPGVELPEPEVQRLMLSFIDFAASMKQRTEIVTSLKDFDLQVYGDKEWNQVLPDAQGPMNDKCDVTFPYYGEEIVEVYRGSKINLNITKYQLKTAINQRVFDVPACGGFLLTDYREDLEQCFKIGKEIIFYEDREDLKEKVAYYLSHTHDRQRIAMAGMNRVRREHDFSHRLHFVFAKVNELFYS